MSDERTLATEVRELFQFLSRDPQRIMKKAIAEYAHVEIGSPQFYQSVASIKAKCDLLRGDILASRLKQSSKNLYAGAVDTLSNYVTVDSLNGVHNDRLKREHQAFEYLTLVEDFLEPLDNRDYPDDFLKSIKKQAQDMLSDLNAREIDARLKAFLEKQIREFIWAIGTFDLLGIEGLSKAWGAMAAEVARSQGMNGSRSPEAKKWYSSALPVLGAIGLAVTSVSATVEHVDNALTHGGNIVKLLTGDEHAEKANDDQPSKAEDETKSAKQ